MIRKGNLTASEKIRRLVHEEKISRKKLASVLGYKNEDYITHLIRGVRSLPKTKEAKLDKFIKSIEAKKMNQAAIEKIRRLVHEEKISRKKLASVLGYKNEDYITHLIRGVRSLPASKVAVLDEFIKNIDEKVVITAAEMVPGEFSNEEVKLTQMMAEQAAKKDIHFLKDMILSRAEEIEKDEREGRTPGLFYFKIFTTKDPVQKIKDFYAGRDEKIVAIYRMWEANKVLGGMYVTMYGGINQRNYARNVLQIIQEMERKGKI